MRNLFYLYATLIGFPVAGYMLRRVLSKYAISYAHQFITFVAMPFLIITSVSASNFIDDLWLAPLISIIAIAIGGILGLIAIDISKINENTRTLLYSNKLINVLDANAYHRQSIVAKSPNNSSRIPKQKPSTKNPSKQTSWHPNLQSNFLIAATTSNGGYIAFPIILLLLDHNHYQYFAITVIYDLCSAAVGGYVLLKILDKSFYKLPHSQTSTLSLDIDKTNHIYCPSTSVNNRVSVLKKTDFNCDFRKLLDNFVSGKSKIILSSLIVGIIFSVFIKNGLPNIILQTKSLMIYLYLTAIGMQINLSKYKFYPSQITSCLIIKMLLIPIVIAAFLAFLETDKLIATTILIMVSMPPLLIDHQLCKEYGLAVEFQVGCHSTGLVLLGLTVPLWITLFS